MSQQKLANNKDNIKAHHRWSFVTEPSVRVDSTGKGQ